MYFTNNIRQDTIHGVAKSGIQLSMYACMHAHISISQINEYYLLGLKSNYFTANVALSPVI